jgi:predicted enzyme related to lactoylglutathione lyase
MKDVIHFYRVEDLDKVKAFYEDLLGFSCYKDQGKCLIYDVHYGKIGFCVHFPKEKAEACVTFVYGCKKEVDDMYDNISQAGIELQASPSIDEYFNIYHFFVKDYNGLTLEFQCFIEE